MPRPTPSKSEGQILPFRPRGSLFSRRIPPPPPAADLDKYQSAPEAPGEYLHRMGVNALALAVTVGLIVTGLWIADVMAHMRKDQDCVLSGRRNCAPIDVPARPR